MFAFILKHETFRINFKCTVRRKGKKKKVNIKKIYMYDPLRFYSVVLTISYLLWHYFKMGSSPSKIHILQKLLLGL